MGFGTHMEGQVASAVIEPMQGAWEKGPVFLELLRMATALDPPTPCLWLATLSSPPHHQARETHTVLDLDSAVKWPEGSRGQLGESVGEVVSPRRFL